MIFCVTSKHFLFRNLQYIELNRSLAMQMAGSPMRIDKSLDCILTEHYYPFMKNLPASLKLPAA